MTDAPKPTRRRFQFSLRTLLVVVTLCAVSCSWLAVKMKNFKQQRKAAAAIEKLGGSVVWSERSELEWSLSLVADDFLQTVREVSLHRVGVTDADLEYLEVFEQLEDLDIANITDDGLAHLEALFQLQRLEVDCTQITDAGLRRLIGLRQLRVLVLTNTEVIDGRSQITDAGLKYLKGLMKLQVLDLRGSQITDAGLERLTAMGCLERLELYGTKVTAAGVNKLKKALPNCRIRIDQGQ